MDRYEKALELARAYYDKDANAFLDTIFPELKESRDEQIRKAIIKSLDLPFMEAKIDGTDVTYEEAVAWLEKQKETSKAIEAVERIDKFIDEYLANAHDMKDSDPDKKYYLGWDDALGKMSGILQDVYSGEKQKEQKPAEWSEEDEKKIHFLSRLIEFQVKDGEYCFGEGSCAISKQEAIEMLKSLRPSWKPSEEQMKALIDCVIGDEYDVHALVRLWAELKKL